MDPVTMLAIFIQEAKAADIITEPTIIEAWMMEAEALGVGMIMADPMAMVVIGAVVMVVEMEAEAVMAAGVNEFIVENDHSIS